MATYVMSDLHGQYDCYLRMLEQIDFQSDIDRLYLVGDVIDRGPDGVPLLLDCMRRKHVTLLLGNHEDLLLYYHQALQTHSSVEFWHKCWQQNGGAPTMQALEACSESQRNHILDFLKSRPLQLSLRINGKAFLLAHACPLNLTEQEYEAARRRIETRRGRCLPSYREFLLWQRVEPQDVFPQDVTVLFGHTPSCVYQSKTPFSFWKHRNMIDLDCGLAKFPAGCLDSRLGCLRLEDMQEFYLTPEH